MNNLYYEESVCVHEWQTAQGKSILVRRLYLLFLLISMIFVALSLILVVGLFMREVDTKYIGLDIALFLLTAIFIVLTFLTNKLQFKLNTCYDYTIDSDEFCIYRIPNAKRRSCIFAMSNKSILQVGNFESETYNKFLQEGYKPIILTPNKAPAENKSFKYILLATNKGKKLIVLECTRNLILNIVNVTTPKVLEPNYK